MYCPRDQRNVETVTGYSIPVLILLLIFGFVIGGVLYFLLTYRDKCPFCGTRDLMAPLAAVTVMMPVAMPGMMAPPMVQQPAPAMPPAATQACTNCGKPIVWYPEHGRWWCAAENRWL